MKIIKTGNVNVALYRGTCGKCGCVVECDEKETKSDYDPRDNYTCTYVKCPMAGCGQTIHVSPKKGKK